MRLTVLVMLLISVIAIAVKVSPPKTPEPEPIVATRADGSIHCLRQATCGF